MRPWQWIALAAGALGALWFLFSRNQQTPPSVPSESTPPPQAPTGTIGTVAGQMAALNSLGLNVTHIDTTPSTTSIGWLGQPKIVPTAVPATPSIPTSPAGPPTSPTPASAPDRDAIAAAFPTADAIFAAAQSGSVSPEIIGIAQQLLIAKTTAATGIAAATGPATETRTGRGHF